MPIVITITDTNDQTDQQARVEVDGEDLKQWEKELLNGQEKLKETVAGRTFEVVEPKLEPKDYRPRNRQALCDAFHILDRTLAELPSQGTAVWAYLNKLGYMGTGEGVNQNAFARYLRTRLADIPAPLPIPILDVDETTVVAYLDDMCVCLNLPEGARKYQTIYGTYGY